MHGRQDSPVWWPRHFLNHYVNGGLFERALVINCGNGWVERELYDLGIFKSAVAFDYSSELLDQARKEAGIRPLEYLQADCNKIEFPENSFDLVINVAAMHHVQYIDRMCRMIATVLKPEGYFLNFDYIGPHRNQYGKEHFAYLEQVNDLLPIGLRKKDLVHPHIETMLHYDPTEAIHSELIIEYLNRYFNVSERLDLNGAIAYQIMHNNHALYDDSNPSAKKAVEFLLEMDELYTHIYKLPALFSYFVAKPNKKILQDMGAMEKYTEEEQQREFYAASNGGKYDYQIDLPDF